MSRRDCGHHAVVTLEESIQQTSFSLVTSVGLSIIEVSFLCSISCNSIDSAIWRIFLDCITHSEHPVFGHWVSNRYSHEHIYFPLHIGGVSRLMYFLYAASPSRSVFICHVNNILLLAERLSGHLGVFRCMVLTATMAWLNFRDMMNGQSVQYLRLAANFDSSPDPFATVGCLWGRPKAM